MIWTRNFSYDEFVHSDAAVRAGVPNIPPKELIQAAHFTLAGMERVRAALQSKPIKILSGYRSFEVNRLVGGSSSSQHSKCEAVDFICPDYGTPKEIVKFLQNLTWVIGIDQMILEPTWVHVSFTPTPRGQVLYVDEGKYRVGPI